MKLLEVLILIFISKNIETKIVIFNREILKYSKTSKIYLVYFLLFQKLIEGIINKN
jgi:hypothetical protein